MRAPLSEIEPEMDFVSMAMRGLPARAASRVLVCRFLNRRRGGPAGGLGPIGRAELWNLGHALLLGLALALPVQLRERRKNNPTRRRTAATARRGENHVSCLVGHGATGLSFELRRLGWAPRSCTRASPSAICVERFGKRRRQGRAAGDENVVVALARGKGARNPQRLLQPAANAIAADGAGDFLRDRKAEAGRARGRLAAASPSAT